MMKTVAILLLLGSIVLLVGCDKEIHEARLDRQQPLLASAQK